MTRDEMMRMLNDYRHHYYEYLMLESKALPKSPALEEHIGTDGLTYEQRLNKSIERKEELSRDLLLIDRSLEELKEVSQDYYRIIYYHYVSIEYPMSLNRISSELFGYDDYTSFWRNGWHRNALAELHDIINKIKKTQ